MLTRPYPVDTIQEMSSLLSPAFSSISPKILWALSPDLAPVRTTDDATMFLSPSMITALVDVEPLSIPITYMSFFSPLGAGRLFSFPETSDSRKASILVSTWP